MSAEGLREILPYGVPVLGPGNEPCFLPGDLQATGVEGLAAWTEGVSWAETTSRFAASQRKAREDERRNREKEKGEVGGKGGSGGKVVQSAEAADGKKKHKRKRSGEKKTKKKKKKKNKKKEKDEEEEKEVGRPVDEGGGAEEPYGGEAATLARGPFVPLAALSATSGLAIRRRAGKRRVKPVCFQKEQDELESAQAAMDEGMRTGFENVYG